MSSGAMVFCDCRHEKVHRDDCDRCEPLWLDDQDYEEPPLYPDGHIEGLTPEQLIAERDRQNRIHDAAVDRCEEINSPTIETAAARASVVRRELERRSLNPYDDKPEAKP